MNNKKGEDLLYKALNISFNHHRSQKDQGGCPYILHPLWMALNASSPREKILCLLHDTIEDKNPSSNVSSEGLLKAGFSQDIVDDILRLTKLPNESLEDSIKRSCETLESAAVKSLDVVSNTHEERVALLNPDVAERLKEKYRETTTYITTYLKAHFEKVLEQMK